MELRFENSDINDKTMNRENEGKRKISNYCICYVETQRARFILVRLKSYLPLCDIVLCDPLNELKSKG